ncbi:hypothetical protein H7K32_11515 [Brevibacillus agri]|uniref:YopX family protein n=1 Tax=Brevibacillus agri TaxID=51101 RepID=UPI001C8E5E79|nr:YopX family protein [Brevibacillus agri]MBY0052300.1 hypothetical protein [Brevibacillus agri]
MQGREIKFECIYRPTKEKFVPAKVDFVNRDVYGDFDGEKYARCYYSTEPDGYGDAWLRQFTGLHDKNGKEIYEGDHMYASGNLYGEEYIGTVVWDKDDARFEVVGLHGRFEYIPDECYVKGNIYENPELLEVGK